MGRRRKEERGGDEGRRGEEEGARGGEQGRERMENYVQYSITSSSLPSLLLPFHSPPPPPLLW